MAGTPVSGEEPLVRGIDVSMPSVARVYDFWPGEKGNLAAGREMGSRMAELQTTTTHARFVNHDAAALASWLAGMEIVPPGVCEATAP